MSEESEPAEPMLPRALLGWSVIAMLVPVGFVILSETRNEPIGDTLRLMLILVFSYPVSWGLVIAGLVTHSRSAGPAVRPRFRRMALLAVIAQALPMLAMLIAGLLKHR